MNQIEIRRMIEVDSKYVLDLIDELTSRIEKLDTRVKKLEKCFGE